MTNGTATSPSLSSPSLLSKCPRVRFSSHTGAYLRKQRFLGGTSTALPRGTSYNEEKHREPYPALPLALCSPAAGTGYGGKPCHTFSAVHRERTGHPRNKTIPTTLPCRRRGGSAPFLAYRCGRLFPPTGRSASFSVPTSSDGGFLFAKRFQLSLVFSALSYLRPRLTRGQFGTRFAGSLASQEKLS